MLAVSHGKQLGRLFMTEYISLLPSQSMVRNAHLCRRVVNTDIVYVYCICILYLYTVCIGVLFYPVWCSNRQWRQQCSQEQRRLGGPV